MNEIKIIGRDNKYKFMALILEAGNLQLVPWCGKLRTIKDEEISNIWGKHEYYKALYWNHDICV